MSPSSWRVAHDRTRESAMAGPSACAACGAGRYRGGAHACAILTRDRMLGVLGRQHRASAGPARSLRSFIGRLIGFAVCELRNCQMPRAHRCSRRRRARGAEWRSEVSPSTAARSSTRSFSALSVSRSLPSSNQKATATLEISTAAAVTDDQLHAKRARPQSSFMPFPAPSRRCSRRPRRS